MDGVASIEVKRSTRWVEIPITSAWGGSGALVTDSTDSTSVTLRNIGDFPFEYRIDAGAWTRLEFHNSVLLNVSLASTQLRLRKSEFGGNALARLEIDSLTNEFSADGASVDLGAGGGATAFTDLTDAPAVLTPLTQLEVDGAGGLACVQKAYTRKLVHWQDALNTHPTTGTIDTTVESYTFAGADVLEGQSVLIQSGDTPEDCGIWVLGAMTDPTAVPVTRRDDCPLGTSFRSGEVFIVNLGNSGYALAYLISVQNSAGDDLIEGDLGDADVFIKSRAFGAGFNDIDDVVGGFFQLLAVGGGGARPSIVSSNDLLGLLDTRYVSLGSGVVAYIASVTADTTLDATFYTVLVDATAGNVVITLPTADSAFSAGVGKVYNVKKIDSSGNTVTVAAAGAETIDGAATQVVTAQFSSLTLQSNGAFWSLT